MDRARLNLVLLSVVVGLVLLVIWNQQQTDSESMPLLSFGEDEVQRIAVRHPDAAEIVLQRDGDGFVLTAPFAAATDRFEVAGLLNLASLDSEKQLPVEGLDLAQLELEPANYELQFNDTVLQVGGVEPLAFRRYVRIGDLVHLIPDPPGTALDNDPSDLVSKQLVPAGRSITQLELPGLTLAKRELGWTMIPEDAQASADQKQMLVDNWTNAKAMWNQSPAEDESSDADEADIIISLDDGSQVLARVVKRDPQLILARPGMGIHQHLSAALAEGLLALPPVPEPEPAAEIPEVDAVLDAAAPADL